MMIETFRFEDGDPYTRSRMTMAITFSRQNEAGSRARTLSIYVVVHVIELKVSNKQNNNVFLRFVV